MTNECTEITEGSKAIMRDMKVMGTPIALVPALSQYKHNNGDGLLFGFDYDETVVVFEKMQAELEELRAKAAAFDLIDGQEIETYYPTNEDMTLKIFPLESVIGGEEYRGKTLLEAVNNARGES